MVEVLVGTQTSDMRRDGDANGISGNSIISGAMALAPDCDVVGEDDGIVVHESRSTRIIRASNNGSHGPPQTSSSVAVKTLVGMPRPSPEDVSCLSNEYSILTRYLTECPGARKALNRGDDENTIYLEWVEGVSLDQWIQDAPTIDTSALLKAGPSPRQCDLLMQKVRIAWGVAKSLAEIHDSGVHHNNFAPDNIIVCSSLDERRDVENGMEARCDQEDQSPVKVIDFGYAEPSSLCETDDSGERVNDDMYSIGVVLHELFVHREQESSIDQKRQLKRSSQLFIGGSPASTASSSLLVAGGHQLLTDTVIAPVPPSTALPPSVSSLLSNLIDTGRCQSLDPYHYAWEVEEDLRQMMENPDVFLFDPRSGEDMSQLNFGAQKLYGRDNEVSALMDAFERVVAPPEPGDGGGIGSTSETVLVSGYSGTGKSSLVRCVRQPLLNKGGYFISGKYDQLQRMEPYSAIIVAFHDLCDLILSKGDEVVCRMRETIQSAVGTQGKVLTDLIPNLENIIGEQPAVPAVTGKESQNRFNFVFRLFARAISTPAHPVVLSVDDLQWADEASLELIKSLVTDMENRSILFIGCYRDNEVNETHPLAQTLREIENKGVTPTKIVLGNLSMETVNLLISETLRVPKRLTRPLTEIVFRKTEGNVFFVIQLLKSLRDEGLLYYHQESLRWRWDMARVASKNLSDNVVEHMVTKIMGLPTEARDVLKVAAGIGSYFDESTLRCIMEARGDAQASCPWVFEGGNVDRVLATLVEEGFVDGPRVGGQYKFAHDRIQQAAYTLIPKDERGLLHLKIGKLISCSMVGVDRMLFVAVDQLNRGSEHIADSAEREELARLNLSAGEKAMQSSAFTPAVAYFKAGINLLDGRWERKGDLSLRLYTAYAETEYCNGNFDQTEILAEEVFKHADTLQEKLPAYNSLIKSLSAKVNLAKAIEMGFDVLLQLGERFPDTVGRCSLATDLAKTKFMLRGKTDVELAALPPMKDPTKAAAMKLLTILYPFCYFAKPDILPLLGNRLVRLSLRYGASNESAFGFTSYGTMLCSMGKFKEGYRFGKLALLLLDRLEAKEWSSHVNLNVAFFIKHWREHMKLQLDPILYGYRIGMEVGDNEFAMLSLFSHGTISYFLGRPLEPLERDLRAYIGRMKDLSRDIAAEITLILLQATLNLMGCSDDPVVLTGGAMNQEEALKVALAAGNMLRLVLIHTHRLVLAYMFGNYKLAEEMARQSDNVAQVAPGMFLVCVHGFYDGLTRLALARRKGKKRCLGRELRIIMKNMRKWARSSPGNWSHKLLILKAEKISLGGSFSETKRAYDYAIAAAYTNGFIQDEALAYERAGVFFFEADNKLMASRYLARAHHLYSDWGAKAKAERLQKDFPFIVTSSVLRRQSFQKFLKGRSLA